MLGGNQIKEARRLLLAFDRAKAVRHRQLCCSTREGKQCRLAGLSLEV